MEKGPLSSGETDVQPRFTSLSTLSNGRRATLPRCRAKDHRVRRPMLQLRQLLKLSELHHPRLAMVDTHWQPPLADTLAAQIAQARRQRKVSELPRTVLFLARAILQDVDSPLPPLQVMLLLACHLTGVTSRAILVIDEQTVSHDAP